MKIAPQSPPRIAMHDRAARKPGGQPGQVMPRTNIMKTKPKAATPRQQKRKATIRINPMAAFWYHYATKLIEEADKAKSRIFPFMRLMPELRNKIYEYALPQDEPVRIQQGVPSAPGLLFVNKQVFFEGRNMFLRQNKFIFIYKDCNMQPLLRFFRVLKLTNDPVGLEALSRKPHTKDESHKMAPLEIFPIGKVFPSKIDGKPFTLPTFEDTQVWYLFLLKLKELGLKRGQVKWLAFLEVQCARDRALNRGKGIDEYGSMKELLFDYLLQYLTKEVGLFSSAAFPNKLVPDMVFDDWKKYGLYPRAALEMARYFHEYCHGAHRIYFDRRDHLITARNYIVQKIIDALGWEGSASLELQSLLKELIRCDTHYGRAIHRDPAVVKQYLARIVATDPLSAQITIAQQAANEEVEETDEERKLREADLKKIVHLHDDAKLKEEVDKFVERIKFA